jgi:hypothetical protein
MLCSLKLFNNGEFIMNKYIKTLCYICLVLFLSSNSKLSAAEKNMGVGIVIGTPFAITGKFIISQNSALDFGAGEAEGDGIYIYGDLLLNIHNFSEVPGMSIYAGIGSAFHEFEKENNKNNQEDENRIELRIPIGLEFSFDPKFNVPMKLFGEIIPTLIISPEIDSEFRGGIGARYFF